MNKKLPGIYANKIDKKLDNNKRVYYSTSDVPEKEGKLSNSINKIKKNFDLNINQKINNIFNSSKYVYKADVVITTKEGNITKKIIGQNKTHLITMENELIPISEILNIDFLN